MSPPKGGLIRPARELKRFEKIALAPGEKKTVRFTLDKRCFAAWDVRIHDWYTEEGSYTVQICKDAETVIMESSVQISPAVPFQPVFTPNSTLGDILSTEKGQAVFGAMMGGAGSDNTSSAFMTGEAMAAMMNSMPLRELISFVPEFNWDTVNAVISSLNQ